MKKIYAFLLILMIILVSQQPHLQADTQGEFIAFLPFITKPQPVVTSCEITAPPTELGLDPFYTKYCSANGLPIISSSEVPDAALVQAWTIVQNMLATRPDVLAEMVNNNTRVGIIGRNQVTTDMPEYADLYTQFPGSDWDAFRGLGATPSIPLSSVGEENLLCYSGDIYRGESIMSHEFAHSIHYMGLNFLDTNFDTTLQSAYQNARNNGLWDNTYAATNHIEYWAEGVQSYFNSNLQASPPNGIHNHVNTRSELQAYDTTLYQLIDTVFEGVVYTPSCP